MSSSGSFAQLKHADKDVIIGSLERLYIIIWRQDTTVAAVNRIGTIFRELWAGGAGPQLLLTVVRPEAAMPPADARKALSAYLLSCAGRLLYSSVAFEGEGFKAAAVRGVITGLNLVSQLPFPHKIFPRVHEAATWLEREARAAGLAVSTPADIAAAVEQLLAEAKS